MRGCGMALGKTASLLLLAAISPLDGATTATATTARAAVAGPVIVDVTDPARDARDTKARGLSHRDRRSIDIRRFTVTDEGDAIRFTFQVDHVARSPRLTQLFLVDVATDALPFGQLMIATHSMTLPPRDHDGLEHIMAIEGTDTPEGFVACHRLPLSMRNGARTFWVEVPKRCLPAGGAELNIYTQTIQPPEAMENRQYSHDRLRIGGTYDLGGTAVAPPGEPPLCCP